MMPRLPVALLLLAVVVQTKVLFKDDFSSGMEGWVSSEKKSDLGKMEISSGKYKGDAGLKTSQDAKFYAYSKKFDKISNKDKELAITFSITHEQNIDCGGGYLKLYPSTVEPTNFHGETPYAFMVGPDICGATKKVHFIFGQRGKDGKQNLLWKKEPRAESDEATHFYTFLVKPDNTYEMYVDNEKKESGDLEADWDFLPPKKIPDPTDFKPEDWVDEAEMADPADKKPSDYDDEPETVTDPDAAKPEDWDEEEDGEWEAPTIPNPKFKGEWKPKMIPNPAYKGVWKQKEIDNPEYAVDDKLYLYDDIGGVGIDVWQVKAGTIFDNIVITDSLADAKAVYDGYKTQLDKEKKTKSDEEEKKRSEEEEQRKKEEAEADEEDEGEGDAEEDKEDL